MECDFYTEWRRAVTSGLKLNDWNDVRLILATAKLGSFLSAANALGIDQKTASKRIAALEAAVGRPLFHRRRRGAIPTEAGKELLRHAQAMDEVAADLEAAMRGIAAVPPATVTVSASEGIQSYLLIPALLGNYGAPLPIDSSCLLRPLPSLAFVPYGSPADITVIATNPSQVPAGRAAMHVRRIGRMTFKIVASTAFPLRDLRLADFDDLSSQPLIDMTMYRQLKGLDPWNELISEHASGPLLTAPNTSAMQRPVAAGAGITIFPGYASMFDPNLTVLDVPTPDLAVDLWLSAHEDILREPSVRSLYDGIIRMFVQSPWFNCRAA